MLLHLYQSHLDNNAIQVDAIVDYRAGTGCGHYNSPEVQGGYWKASACLL